MSGFRDLHPVVLILYYAGLLLAAALLRHPLYLLTVLLAAGLLLLAQGQKRKLTRTLPFVALVAGGAMLINPLFSRRGSHILFYFLDRPVTLEAVLFGLISGTALAAMLVVFVAYNYTISMDKFMFLFASVAPRTALLVLMAVGFVPMLQRRLTQITLVQRTRGITVSSGSLRSRMANGMTLLKVLLVWSLEEAIGTADSMKARGYGIGPRSAYHRYRPDRRDWICLALLLTSGAACAAGWWLGYGRMEIYPRLQPVSFGAGEAAVYGSFCLFAFLPLAVEGKEKWIWRLSVRKSSASGTRKNSGPPLTGYRLR